MTLPNEIDQDVACPDCGEAFAIPDDGAGWCENGNCVSAHEWRSRKHVAALRNQRTPGTTEIPTSELEALRDVRVTYPATSGAMVHYHLFGPIDAILAHIPAKSLSCGGKCNEHSGGHRGRVRPVIVGPGWGEFNYCDAAIVEDRRRGFRVFEEAAIEAMEKKS
jgi:hypothetical protein